MSCMLVVLFPSHREELTAILMVVLGRRHLRPCRQCEFQVGYLTDHVCLLHTPLRALLAKLPQAGKKSLRSSQLLVIGIVEK